MKRRLSAGPLGLAAAVFAAVLAVPMPRAVAAPVVVKPKADTPVTVTDFGGTWVLDNGIVQATISKGSGRLSSLVFHGIDTMGSGGYWEQTPLGAPD